MNKDFWLKSKISVIGGGSWGTCLAHLASANCSEVRLWVRSEEQAREINANRVNLKYLPELKLRENLRAVSDPKRIFEGGVDAIVWGLPSRVTREQARFLAPLFDGREIIIHATKGVEEGSLKRISTILREELPCHRIGVVSGPNLAKEVAQGQPGATVVASTFDEVVQAGQQLFNGPTFRVYPGRDVVGIEWAGVLKNVLAIASGAIDALGFGWNARAMLISRGLAEMVRFGLAMGGEQMTFLGLAGVGDLMATCSSPLSRNYRVGFRLAKGDPIDVILRELGSTAEGVKTTYSVREFARKREISMPITEGVYQVLEGQPAGRVLEQLMLHPVFNDGVF
ncbi:MAG: NAD(P)H-dependent glycerol-3-phosphate dehydrogenase [Bacteriovoracia bacterium]